ncbi:MAG: ABC transporter permease, partial [Curvibacter sp.]|nr:ABC transporter permease [Curvibacter sp.]
MRRLMHSPVPSLLATFSWQELRQHPWRHAAAVLAMTLGVALAFSVQLINHSALAEFAQALRSVNGQADLELHAVHGQFNEALYERVLLDAQTATASPVLELNTLREGPPASPGAAASPLRLLGIDALRIAGINPDLLPRPRSGAERLAMLLPGHVFLNDAAMAANHGAATLRLDTPGGNRSLQVSGRINASGPPLAVMDLGAAQDLFAQWGRLSRIDLRLTAGSDRQGYLDRLALPGDVVAVVPADLNRRTDSLSRAYRVNLTVLALVALFTGAFLVFSVLSLGVAQRSRQWALLGVLGL